MADETRPESVDITEPSLGYWRRRIGVKGCVVPDGPTDRQIDTSLGDVLSQCFDTVDLATESASGKPYSASFLQRAISYSNSVCLSVRPYVTRRYCVKMTARSTVQFAPLDSKMYLVV